METMTTLSALNLMPGTREQSESFANDIISRVKAGEINPLALKAQIKFIEKTLELIDKATKEEWMEEANKYGKKFEYKGWKVEEVEAGVSYGYEKCGDVYWEHENAKLLAVKDSLKQREAFLRTIKGSETIAEPFHGEIITVYPPVKKSTTTLKFTAL